MADLRVSRSPTFYHGGVTSDATIRSYWYVVKLPIKSYSLVVDELFIHQKAV